MAERPPEALLEDRVERLLPGVTERRVAEIVTDRDRLGEILVEPERSRHDTGNSARLERVRETRAEVVAAGRDEHLSLVLETPEGLRVDDAVAIALERRSQPALLLRLRAPARLVRAHREGRQRLLLEGANTALEALGDRSSELGHLRLSVAAQPPGGAVPSGQVPPGEIGGHPLPPPSSSLARKASCVCVEGCRKGALFVPTSARFPATG